MIKAETRYLDYSGRDDVLSGGVRMIPIDTPKGVFKVWTKRVGNNPKARVLLLHGGPAATHEYWEVCDSYLPAAGIEYYYYDQLGSAYSDQPDDPELWEIALARAKEAVAIVRGLLTQKKFSYDGQWFKPHDFHLREGPIENGAPPIWLAGLGPKMVRTAAEVADGVIANWLTDESLAEYRGLIKLGAESAGRDPGDVQIATLLMTRVDPMDEAALFAARRGIAFYCASEHYLHIADICGLGADARKVKVAWEERDFDRATKLVSDELLRKFSLVGTATENAERIQWLFDNGVYPIVYPLPRREQMAEDHRSVLEQASRWARAAAEATQR